MASGKPDWYSSVAMHGKHLNDYITVAVDVDGNMIGIMQGEGPAGLDTIALDASGRMLANLAAQDIEVITVSNTPGDPVHALIMGSFAGIGAEDVIDITGNGVILGGYLFHDTAISHKRCYFTFYIDGVVCAMQTFEDINKYNLTGVDNYFFRALCYDDTNFRYCVGFTSGVYFKTSLKLRVSEVVGAGDFVGFLLYTFNP